VCWGFVLTEFYATSCHEGSSEMGGVVMAYTKAAQMPLIIFVPKEEAAMCWKYLTA